MKPVWKFVLYLAECVLEGIKSIFGKGDSVK